VTSLLNHPFPISPPTHAPRRPLPPSPALTRLLSLPFPLFPSDPPPLLSSSPYLPPFTFAYFVYPPSSSLFPHPLPSAYHLNFFSLSFCSPPPLFPSARLSLPLFLLGSYYSPFPPFGSLFSSPFTSASPPPRQPCLRLPPPHPIPAPPPPRCYPRRATPSAPVRSFE